MDRLRAALICAVVATSGCISSHTLVLHPRKHANRDRRFYVVVRAVKDQEFYTDGYQRIAEMVFAPQPDPSVKLVRVISPGHLDKVSIKLPDDQSFGIYALFTEPSESWKVQITAPLKGRYHVFVEGNRLRMRDTAQATAGNKVDVVGAAKAAGGALSAAKGLAQ